MPACSSSPRSVDNYNGPTRIDAGTLVVQTTVANSNIVLNGGSLGGGIPAVPPARSRHFPSKRHPPPGSRPSNPGLADVPFLTTNKAIVTANNADFSNGGNLRLQLSNYLTPATDYDRLIVNSALTLGGISSLTLDLNGLNLPGLIGTIVTACAPSFPPSLARTDRHFHDDQYHQQPE